MSYICSGADSVFADGLGSVQWNSSVAASPVVPPQRTLNPVVVSMPYNAGITVTLPFNANIEMEVG